MFCVAIALHVWLFHSQVWTEEPVGRYGADKATVKLKYDRISQKPFVRAHLKHRYRADGQTGSSAYFGKVLRNQTPTCCIKRRPITKSNRINHQKPKLLKYFLLYLLEQVVFGIN